MPETFSGTDAITYRLTKKISPYLANVSPNMISILSLLMMIPIINNLYYNGTTINIIFFVFIKQFLDCLDGTVAREHGKITSTGVALDFICDYISGLIYLWFVVNLFITKKIYRKNKAIIFITLCLLLWLVDDIPTLYKIMNCAKNNNKNNNKNNCGVKNDYNIFTKFLHDNSVIVQVIGVLILKLNII